MAGARGCSLEARAMGCQVAKMTLKVNARVSSPLPARPGFAQTYSAAAEFAVKEVKEVSGRCLIDGISI
jgi:hypothetical protein